MFACRTPHRRAVCVLLSGGLDSAVALHRTLHTGARVVPLYLRCGLSWEVAEMYWLRRLLQALRSPQLLPLRVVSVPVHALYGTHWSLTGHRIPNAHSPDAAVYLPGRNVLLLTAAAIVCARQQFSSITIGVLRSNPFKDASPRFMTQLARCLSQALDVPIRILTPLRRLSKTQLIRMAGDVPLGLTFSCLHPQGRWHCGRCNKCAERRRAFRHARVDDPTRYATSWA